MGDNLRRLEKRARDIQGEQGELVEYIGVLGSHQRVLEYKLDAIFDLLPRFLKRIIGKRAEKLIKTDQRVVAEDKHRADVGRMAKAGIRGGGIKIEGKNAGVETD